MEQKMSILGWIVLGLLAGWIGSHIVDNGGKGPLLDMLLGLVGAIVGGAIFNALGALPVTGFNLYSLFVAVVGAVVVLVIYHAIAGRRRLL
jgi:uncharacterized membrane protein YeaQ/YmgE (transglycosylase-associated protein family)